MIWGICSWYWGLVWAHLSITGLIGLVLGVMVSAWTYKGELPAGADCMFCCILAEMFVFGLPVIGPILAMGLIWEWIQDIAAERRGKEIERERVRVAILKEEEEAAKEVEDFLKKEVEG